MVGTPRCGVPARQDGKNVVTSPFSIVPQSRDCARRRGPRSAPSPAMMAYITMWLTGSLQSE
jgi:hypothetical protein